MSPFDPVLWTSCMNLPHKMEDSGMSSDQSTTPENSLSQRPSNAVYGDVAEAKKVGEVEDTDDSDLNNSFQQVT